MIDAGGELDGLIRLVSNVTDAFTAAAFLPDDEGVLRLGAAFSLSDHLVEDCAVSVGQGLIGWVAENDRPVNVSPFRHDARTLQLYDAPESIKSFLAVPIRLGSAVGVLSIDSKRTYQFATRTEAVLASFAEVIGRRVVQMQEVRHLVGGASQLDALRAFCHDLATGSSWEDLCDRIERFPHGIVPHAGAVLAWRSAGEAGGRGAEDGPPIRVMRARGIGAEGLEGHAVDVAASLLGWVHRKERVLYLSDLDARRRRTPLCHGAEPRSTFRSFLGAPLRVGGRPLGVLAFTNEEPTAYPRQMSDALGVVADVVAASLLCAERGGELDERVGAAPASLVAYGRFLEEVAGWLGAGETVELVALDPVRLGHRNRQLGFGRVNRLLIEVQAAVSRLLDPVPRIAPVAPGIWAAARVVDPDSSAEATERLLERTFRDKVFGVEDLETPFPTRVAVVRSARALHDPDALVQRALDKIDELAESDGDD